MGNDGGSIPDRRDLVKTRTKAEQADKANQVRARWFFCALSKRLLREPVVSCDLGKLYNKDTIIEYLLDKSAYGDGQEICRHIRSLKDIKTLKLTARSTPVTSTGVPPSEVPQFVCPLNLKEMNGVQPFVYIRSCGCVFSQSALRTLLTPNPSTREVSNSEDTSGDSVGGRSVVITKREGEMRGRKGKVTEPVICLAVSKGERGQRVRASRTGTCRNHADVENLQNVRKIWTELY